MSNNYYQLYVNDVIKLAQTLVIKSVDTADAQNQYITEQIAMGLMPSTYAVDASNPTTWRYYMNLAGLYHPADTQMTVVSLDTLETIVFNQANLLVHQATKAAYQFGTRQYEELVSLYPTQETLIKGILHPIDIATAVDADDWEILYWDTTLVEDNEYSLILNLQSFIDGMLKRWVNKKYNLAHEYYPIYYHGMMYLMLIPEILNLRLTACGTNEAHSYHVRSFFASRLGLDQYLDSMTLSQSLFFYRNLDYLIHHTGMQSTFDTLMENLLTVRNIPLNAITMHHDTSAMPTDVDPTIVFDRVPLNTTANTADADTLSLDELLDMEAPLARSNAAMQQDMEPTILIDMQYSRTSTLQTKTLESSMIDYTNSNPYNLPDILLNHWLYLSGLGLYQPYVFPISPKTGVSVPVTTRDAFTLMYYCLAQTYGIDLTESAIPLFKAQRVQVQPKATVAQMLAVVPEPYRTEWASDAQTVLNFNPAITTMASTQAFYTLGTQITQAAQMQRNVIAQIEDMDRHAYWFNAISQIYADVLVNLADSQGQTFDAWFKARNLDFSDYTTDEYAGLAAAILSTATGQDLHATESLKDLQKAMINMFQTLSSYSIQFVAKINQSTLVDLDTAEIRLGYASVAAADNGYLDNEGPDILEALFGTVFTDVVDLGEVFAENVSMGSSFDFGARTGVDILPDSNGVIIETYIEAGTDAVLLGTDVHGNDIPMNGIDRWFTLTPAQQSSLAEVMSNENFFWLGPNPS